MCLFFFFCVRLFFEFCKTLASCTSHVFWLWHLVKKSASAAGWLFWFAVGINLVEFQLWFWFYLISPLTMDVGYMVSPHPPTKIVL